VKVRPAGKYPGAKVIKIAYSVSGGEQPQKRGTTLKEVWGKCGRLEDANRKGTRKPYSRGSRWALQWGITQRRSPPTTCHVQAPGAGERVVKRKKDERVEHWACCTLSTTNLGKRAQMTWGNLTQLLSLYGRVRQKGKDEPDKGGGGLPTLLKGGREETKEKPPKTTSTTKTTWKGGRAVAWEKEIKIGLQCRNLLLVSLNKDTKNPQTKKMSNLNEALGMLRGRGE